MIAGAQFTIVDLNDPIQQGSAPDQPATGMLWLDTSVTPPMLRRYSGTAWEIVGDSGAGAEALQAVQQLQAANDIVVGTQTASTNKWTGVTGLSSLKDGQQLTYWLPFAGTSSSATLTLTLKDGTSTGAVPCYYSGTTRMTTHYAAGNAIHLTYRENVTIGSTPIAKGWWGDANYDSNTYDRVRLNNAVKAKSAISASRIVVGDDAGYYHLASSVSFIINKPILWAGSAIAAGETGTTNYLSYPTCTLRNNVSGYTGTAQKTCYLKGTLDGQIFTPAASMFTDTIPTEEDGLVYISFGHMASTYQIYLFPEHPMYMYLNGEFRNLNQVAYDAQMTANDATAASVENAASINTLQTQIKATVSKTTYDEDKNAIDRRMSTIEQTASNYRVEISREIDGKVATVAGEVADVAEDIAGFKETVSGYMEFDGDTLSLGKTGSSFKTEITNTEMAFKENGERVAYISNSDMYITRARVTDTLSVGTVTNGYFDFVTLPGGLALKWRTGSSS